MEFSEDLFGPDSSIQDGGQSRRQIHPQTLSNASHSPIQRPKPPRRPKPPANPLQRGLYNYFQNHTPDNKISSETSSALLSTLPKRYTLYSPLLLLAPNTLTATPAWSEFISSLSASEAEMMYSCIANAFTGAEKVTHIAYTAPISAQDTAVGGENLMRRPSGLVPLYGNFGPEPIIAAAASSSASGLAGNGDEREKERDTVHRPARQDFEAAFWVRVVQNGGIAQVFAPRYSMFSRGNVTEKARILGIGHEGQVVMEGLNDEVLGQKLSETAVVDMYAGIGYFCFSYLKRGVGRVWGWELNPWAVEGLRRGAGENGWGVRVVRVGMQGEILDEEGREVDLKDLVESLRDEERMVVFHGDNTFAKTVLPKVRELLDQKKRWKSIRHVNLGLLPYSNGAWEGSLVALDTQEGGWLHVHENVEISIIQRRSVEIVEELASMALRMNGGMRFEGEPRCCHVENVKTYAPGVMHCVFDVFIPPLVKQS